MDPTPSTALVHSKKLHIKEDLSAYIGNQHFQKLFYFSFQIVQNKQRDATFQTFSLFFPVEQPCQLSGVALIRECNTHTTPNKEKTNFHNNPTLEVKEDVITRFLLALKKNKKC